jgi:hypothetical protein
MDYVILLVPAPYVEYFDVFKIVNILVHKNAEILL